MGFNSILPYMALLLYATLAITQTTTNTASDTQTTSTAASDTQTGSSSTGSTTNAANPTTTSGAIALLSICANNLDFYHVPMSTATSNIGTLVTPNELYTVNGSIVVFKIHCGVDFGAGPEYSNPGIYDLDTFSGSDLNGCITHCLNNNAPLAYDNLGVDRLCSGISFLNGVCWTKRGVTENAVRRNVGAGGSAIMHLLAAAA